MLWPITFWQWKKKILRLTASLLLHWNKKSSHSAFGAWSPQAIYLPTVGKRSHVLLEVFIYTSVALENYADSGVGAEKSQFQQTWLCYNMEPFLAREIKKACLPKAACHWAEIRIVFGGTLRKTISSLYKWASNGAEYLLGLRPRLVPV